MKHWLRPVDTRDREFLLALFASTRESELDLTGWSTMQRRAFVAMQFKAQEQHFARQFPRSLCRIIMLKVGDGSAVAVGRLWVDRRDDALHVLDIALLASARGSGLGTRCLRDLMARARHEARRVTLRVALESPARRLYRRLGFAAEGQPEGAHQFMAWSPATVPETAREECSTC